MPRITAMLRITRWLSGCISKFSVSVTEKVQLLIRLIIQNHTKYIIYKDSVGSISFYSFEGFSEINLMTGDLLMMPAKALVRIYKQSPQLSSGEKHFLIDIVRISFNNHVKYIIVVFIFYKTQTFILIGA